MQVAEHIISQLRVILQTHAIAATLSEPQSERHCTDLPVQPGKALISGCVSPKSACLHALMVSSKHPVVGHPVCVCVCMCVLKGIPGLAAELFPAVINSKDKAEVSLPARF